MTRPTSSFHVIDRQVLLGLIAVLAVLVLIRGYVRSQVTAVEAATEWVDHTHRVLEAVAAVDAQLVDARLGQRLHRLGGDSGSAVRHRSATVGVDTALARLRVLTRDNARQRWHVDSLQTLARELLDSPERR